MRLQDNLPDEEFPFSRGVNIFNITPYIKMFLCNDSKEWF